MFATRIWCEGVSKAMGVLQSDSQALRKKVEQHQFATVNKFVVDFVCYLAYPLTRSLNI